MTLSDPTLRRRGRPPQRSGPRPETASHPSVVSVPGLGPLAFDLFAAIAGHHPAATATRDRDGETSYGQLRCGAAKIAAELRARGARPGRPVGVSVGRTRHAVSAFLGVLLSGAAYVPIDPRYPAARRRDLLERAGCCVLLQDDDGALDGSAVPTLRLADALAGPAAAQADWPAGAHQADWPAAAQADRPAAAHQTDWPAGAHQADWPAAAQADRPADGWRPSPSDLAYILFTSGTTGTPKGVQVTHANLAALLAWYAREVPAEELARVGATTSFSFDPSVVELFGTLAAGGCLHVLDSPLALLASAPEPGSLTDLTYLSAVPSVLHELARAGRISDRVRVVQTGGERLNPATARAVLAAIPHGRLLHCYGPTEATVLVSCQVLRPADPIRIHLGRPLPGSTLWLLDEAGRPVPDGTVGEVAVSGAQVAAGYLGVPASAPGAFSYWRTPGGKRLRLYKTGDLARRDPDTGELTFEGRADRQVKIRGFRVEPGEVEDVMLRHPDVRAAAVIPIGTAAAARLAGFIVPRPGRSIDLAAVRAELQARLPAHCVPATLHLLHRLPRTATDKLDTAALIASISSTTPATSRSRHLTGAEAVVASAVAALLELDTLPGADTDVVDDLGLSSLGLVQLLGRIERSAGLRPKIEAVLADTTVRGIAAAATSSVAPRSIWLNQGGQGDPIVLLHVYVGGLLRYRSLTEHVGGRPLLLIDAMAGIEPSAEVTIDELAAHAARTIRSEVPTGRVVVAGHSAGGLLAMAVAGQLSRENTGSAPGVVLIDTPALRHRIDYYWGELVLHVPEFLAGSWRARWDKLRLIAAKNSGRARRQQQVPSTVATVYERERTSTTAVLSATARTYHGAVSILTTRQGRVMAGGSKTLGWGGHLVQRPRVLRVPGRHTGLFDPEHVPQVAAALVAAADGSAVRRPASLHPTATQVDVRTNSRMVTR